MQRILADRPHPLHDLATTRTIEAQAIAALAPHTLMQRAGLAGARLARALAPHARQAWVVCGPGNNGGDGLEAAAHLQRAGLQVTATWLGDEARLPADAARSLAHARAAGVRFAAAPPSPLGAQDIAIDALLGIGLAPGAATRSPPAAWLPLLAQLRAGPATLLCLDIPSGLQADTGAWADGFAPAAPGAATVHTLALLTLKPGLFTAAGRDAAGTVWLDALGVDCGTLAPASATLTGPPAARARLHASHKGLFGDVAIVGGESLALRGQGMEGAALLAAIAALHHGAGRVLVALLGGAALPVALHAPELMQRELDQLVLEDLCVVCGCGGGAAVAAHLPAVLARAGALVLDADALNAVAHDSALADAVRQRSLRGQRTVLTPHPLEAARLLRTSVAAVQADRLAAAQSLAAQWDCVCVLKGSGTVVAAPGHLPCINATGNARLASAGTGDVLAGMLGAELASGRDAFDAACAATYVHGWRADHWPGHQPLVASALARGQKYE